MRAEKISTNGGKTIEQDKQKIREQARQSIESGAVTKHYPLDTKEVIELLNGALATELVCVLRYRLHHYMAKGMASPPIAAEFLEHSDEELRHADMLAERITQLGGEPEMNPDELTSRSLAEFKDVRDLKEMVRENLVAERIAVDHYREMIEFFGDKDPTSRKMVEEILAIEEEHADDLARLMDS
jgi:Bacterioferritin (cytochrome b1)